MAGILIASFPPDRVFTPDERRGVVAELEAWRFQRTRAEERRTWDMYWSTLSGWTNPDGTLAHYPDIADIDDEIIAHWIERATSSPHPVFRARFADLAWEIGRFKNTNIPLPHTIARAAIDDYLLSVSQGLHHSVFDSWLWLHRASALATSLKDEPRFLKARAAAFALFRSVDLQKEPSTVWLFDDLMWDYDFRPLKDSERAEIVDALERELALRTDISKPASFDPNTAMDVATRLRRWRDDAGETDASRRALTMAGEAFEKIAEKADGLLAVGWLEGLLPQYRAAKMPDAVARVERTIRERAKDAAAEMKRASAQVDIPKAELDAWADQVAGDGVAQGLTRLAGELLIKEGASEDGVKDMLRGAVLMSTMTITLSGPTGFTEATVGSLDDDLEGRALMYAAQLLTSWHAPFINLALSRITEKHGLTANGVLAHVKACQFFAEEREPLLRRGIETWLAGDFMSAVHILVPQIEAALRDCLAFIGGSTMRPNRHGGFKAATFGEILSDPVFRSIYPRDVRFHLRALYTDPRGVNVRNHLAHGLAHPSQFQRGLGNLVLHSLLMVAMVQPTPKPAPPGNV